MTQTRRRMMEAWYSKTPEERAAPEWFSIREEIRRHHVRTPTAGADICKCGKLAARCEPLLALEGADPPQ